MALATRRSSRSLAPCEEKSLLATRMRTDWGSALTAELVKAAASASILKVILLMAIFRIFAARTIPADAWKIAQKRFVSTGSGLDENRTNDRRSADICSRQTVMSGREWVRAQ